MNRKGKGISAERELIHALWSIGWAAHRIAGSGSSKYPSPDVIAGNGGRILAIECKVCKGDNQYFTKQEIEELQTFSKMFGAESYLAVKFAKKGWFYMKPEHLKETEKSFAMSRAMCDLYGKSLEDVVK